MNLVKTFLNNIFILGDILVDYTSVYCSTLIAIILVLSITLINHNKVYYSKFERKYIIITITSICLGAFLDPFLYYSNGRSDPGHLFVNTYLNGIQYPIYTFLSLLWFLFNYEHIYKHLNRKQIALFAIPLYITFLGIIINYFCPFIYKVDENHIYQRMWGYYFFVIINAGYMLASLIQFFTIKRIDQRIIFFPTPIFITIILFGVVFHIFYTNISLVYPLVAVSYACILSSLQNESHFTDKLTNNYNRSFLDYYLKTHNKDITGLIIDINHLKTINDTYGHKAGDKALEVFGYTMKHTIATRGICIRYAGDEFFVFMRSLNEDEIVDLMEKVRLNVLLEVKKDKLPYTITFSYGFGTYSSKECDFDTFFNMIDKRMYEEKVRFHNEHPETPEVENIEINKKKSRKKA